MGNVFVETPGRKFTVVHLWNVHVLPKVTTVLPKATKENEDNVAETTEDEEVELSLTTGLYVMEETNAQIQGGVDDLNELIEEAARHVEFDDDAEVEQDEAPNDQAPEPMIIEVTIGAGTTARKVNNVWRVPVNTMAIHDTMATGQAKIQGMDLVNDRLRAKCSARREQRALQDDVFHFLTNMGGDYDQVMRDVGHAATATNTATQRMSHRATAR